MDKPFWQSKKFLGLCISTGGFVAILVVSVMPRSPIDAGAIAAAIVGFFASVSTYQGAQGAQDWQRERRRVPVVEVEDLR